MGTSFFTTIILLLIFFNVGECGTYCTWYEDGYWRSIYCDYECCNDRDGNGYYCCGVNISLIIGATIGGLVFLGFVIFLCACICMQKHKKSQGRIMAVPGQTNVVTYTTTTMGTMPPPYQQNQPYPNADGGTNYYNQQYSTAPTPSAPTTSNVTYPPAPAVYTTADKQ